MKRHEQLTSWNSMDEYQIHYDEQKKPDTTVQTVWFHFYEAIEQAKLLSVLVIGSVVAWVDNLELIEKGQEGTFLGDRDVLPFPLGGIYMGFGNFQNLPKPR